MSALRLEPVELDGPDAEGYVLGAAGSLADFLYQMEQADDWRDVGCGVES